MRKPKNNWYKLNTYAWSLGNLEMAREGGIMCDYDGFWILEFTKVIEILDSVEAKLWALRGGMRLCQKSETMGFKKNL